MNAPMTKDEIIATGDVSGLIRVLREEFEDFEDNVPAHLKQIKGWFVWKIRNIKPSTGKFGKIPFYPLRGSRPASPRRGEQGGENDRAYLGTWNEARSTLNSDKSFAGVGFATLKPFGIVALDVDHCVKDGVIREDVLLLTKDTYCEISPSGTGVRAFWQGVSSDGKNNDTGYELFHAMGFVTVTGHVVKNDYHRRHPGNKSLTVLDSIVRSELERLCRAPGKSEALLPVDSTIDITIPEVCEPLPAHAIADLRNALVYMRADDRELWQRMGHCLKTLGEVGRDLWLEWSTSSDKHDPDADLKTWDSFKPTRSGWRGVFSEAQRQGWMNPASGSNREPQVDFRHMGEGSWPQLGQANTAVGDSDRLVSLEQNIITLNVSENPFDTLPHYVDKWIPNDEVTLLAGHGGSGKSYVALSIAVHVALGRPFADLLTTQARVLFFSGEDGAAVLRQRLARICLALKIDPSELEGKLYLLDASDIDPTLHREQRVMLNGHQQVVTETHLLNTLASLVRKLDIGLVILDNASDTYDDDEIRRTRVRAFVRSLRSRIARPGRAVLLLAHINKASANGGRNSGTEDYSGSTAWHNSVRSRLSLVFGTNQTLTIEHMKANLGSKAEPVRLEWHDGIPLVVGLYTSEGVQAAEKMRDDTDKAALVALILSFEKRGERVTTSFQGSATVFRLLKGVPGFPKNTDSERLMRLLRGLETEGRIFRRTVRTLDRKFREGFTCAPITESGAGVNEKEACAN